jgi:hypothetical protein
LKLESEFKKRVSPTGTGLSLYHGRNGVYTPVIDEYLDSTQLAAKNMRNTKEKTFFMMTQKKEIVFFRSIILNSIPV